ncbi:unnamed protein product, partial [Heterosigma akashiwo]
GAGRHRRAGLRPQDLPERLHHRHAGPVRQQGRPLRHREREDRPQDQQPGVCTPVLQDPLPSERAPSVADLAP